MRSLGKFVGRLFLAAGVGIAGIWLLVPGEPVVRAAPVPDMAATEAESALLAVDGGHEDLVPEAAARIIWAGEPGVRTDVVVLYLHGFSATLEEIRPVPDNVAAALGANLVYPRLSGHGRDGAAMAEPVAGDWIDDTAVALAAARAVGDRVIVIGTSTGATLASYAMTEADMAAGVAGVVMISPNFRLANRAGVMLEWPLARLWLPWIVGAEYGFTPISDRHALFWTESYPSISAVPLAALMRVTRERDYTGVIAPALFVFSDLDQVIAASAVREFASGWGGPITLSPQDIPPAGADPRHHVIAGDIVSPAMTDVVSAEITAWAQAVLR